MVRMLFGGGAGSKVSIEGMMPKDYGIGRLCLAYTCVPISRVSAHMYRHSKRFRLQVLEP